MEDVEVIGLDVREDRRVERELEVDAVALVGLDDEALTAGPLGKFSVNGVKPWTTTFAGFTADNAFITAKTEAAPAMSYFMVSMDAGGFSDNPPESKVIPFPQMPMVRLVLPRPL